MRQLVAAVPERNALISHVKRLVISRPCSILQPGETGVFHRTHIHVPCEGESPHLMSSGLNGAKMSKIWGSLLPRRGYRILAQGFSPGNRPPGRRALKGRQVIVISNRREKHISIATNSLRSSISPAAMRRAHRVSSNRSLSLHSSGGKLAQSSQ